MNPSCPLFERPLVLVDLETTGADPHRDRITEVAILRVEAGALVADWAALVNPGIPIPPRIQAFTGIDDAMVADAPSFEQLADALTQRLDGAVFVAHNARFDLNFLRAAFARLGQAFAPEVLCTVKLSRALYPEHARHGLDALIARHGYQIAARHRARDDARVLWQFLGDCARAHPPEVLAAAMRRAGSHAEQVARLPEGELEALPTGPGAYVFFDAAGQGLHVGRAGDLRSRVLGYFTAPAGDAKARKLATQVRRVEAVSSAGELSALLAELALARAHLPGHAPSPALAWHWQRSRKRAPVLQLTDLAGSDPLGWDDHFGSFRGEREAGNALRELALLHRLCPLRIGLERGAGPCQAHGLGRCAGVCVQRETPAAHDARLDRALASLRVRPWPFSGPVLVSEFHRETGRSAAHLLDHWCLLGSAQDEAAAAELLAAPPPRAYDLDVARLLARWLAAPGNLDRLRVCPAAC